MIKFFNRYNLIVRGCFINNDERKRLLKEFAKHILIVQNNLDIIARPMNHIREKEEILLPDLLAAETKVGEIDEIIFNTEEATEAEKARLLKLKKESEDELEAVKAQLSENKEVKEPVIQDYQSLKKSYVELIKIAELLRGMLYATKVKQYVFGSYSGVDSTEGISQIKGLIKYIKIMETKAGGLLD